MEPVETEEPEQAPMQRLLKKLDLWLIQQPEWPILFLADRQTRRDAARLISKHITTIPTRRR